MVGGRVVIVEREVCTTLVHNPTTFPKEKNKTLGLQPFTKSETCDASAKSSSSFSKACRRMQLLEFVWARKVLEVLTFLLAILSSHWSMGRFLGIIGEDSSVSKSNQLHIVILCCCCFFFWRYNIEHVFFIYSFTNDQYVS